MSHPAETLDTLDANGHRPLSADRASQNTIRIRGARQHNLKNIDLELPRDRLIVFTGVSGSGKSSLAFDTIFAEGQRRYVESLSAYARQFLGQLDKPDVEAIEGLSPAISIDQKSTSHNPRSTVGTVTEIYDYLRLLFGRAGKPHCPICDRSIAPQTIDEMSDRIMELPDRTRFQILAPVVRGKKGTHRKLLSSLASEGFARVRINGEVRELSDSIELDKNQTHNIEVVVDRLIKKPGITERLTDSLTTCLRRSEGIAVIEILDRSEADANNVIMHPTATQMKAAEESTAYVTSPLEKEIVFSENFACPEHGAVMEELSPRLFSFNSPYGACPHCHGLGSLRTFSPELVIPDPSQPVYAAIAPWSEKDNSYYLSLLYSVGQAFGFEIKTLWKHLTPEQQQVILHGAEQPIWNHDRNDYRRYAGVIPILQRQYNDASELIKQKLEQYLVNQPCEVCQGQRLKPEALAVRLGQHRILDLTGVSIRDCQQRIHNLKLSDRQMQIADLVLREIKARLQFLLDVGLDYLTLDRPAMTLSGGEAQRIRLATQIGSGLTGVLYVLDEPSIGLHQRDNGRLLKTLTRLRDLGNTLIVVEHDEETIRAADHVVDIGPGAGIHGGNIIAQGDLQALLAAQDSLTGAYLSGRQAIATPAQRREGNGRSLVMKNAYRNNLRNIDVEIPLGKLVCVTGVSGSGKSTLINELLYPTLQHHLTRKVPFPQHIDTVQGLDAVDKAIVIDQSPIGRTPRSNPATYTGVFDAIRDVFSQTIEAKARGYKPGQFSFNVKGGRCEACSGQGVNVIEMNFLPDVYVQCEVCKGARYNRETLQVKYKGKSIADVLDMTVEESLEVFQNIPKAFTRLQTLVDVGLGYIKLGQPATTLSGGEAQRVKLATELSRRATGKTLYLIDEPTTGLSFYDVHKLLDVLQRLVDKGNSILVIEHNLDVIRCSDWIIDLGPDGGDKGGELVAAGTPESVAENPHSYTGQYIKQVLQQHPLAK
ncbi:excinuclease ABC subunit UvrA [Gloeocapsopsis dulcis]|uniref:UvrABC system protein A n=1 Tax=Gloeocapsopsis dulcis AAB1 = 1H9 TaxID=1433147 RepID=A0A6N8FWV2_9CHRO|nr:excinuclease ABC subunit UvrA [Gloeocapsopsis dulcis]MUL36627.1 excinuclease ABC subunit A [Gloeocapsopsis dulcis AAB1 = 1H9]WNN87253.1 excinuclease ABC subunit UvrA [Gloeocapsopsis dulcis]